MESVKQSNILAIHSMISQFHEEEKYYDITIRVGAETFKCHQLLLCASSEYFDRMFKGHFVESDVGKDKPVQLKGVDSAAFKEVLNFMYTGDVLITDSNYYELIRASDFLQLRVPHIEKQCIDYLQNTVILKLEPIANAIEMFHFARASSRELLLGILAEHIFGHLNHFLKESEFLNLSHDDFNLILKCKSTFSCFNEDLLMETITQWLNHTESEKRRKWREELMTHVDKSRLSQRYISFLIESCMNSMVRHSPEKTVELFEELIQHVDTSKLSAQMLTSCVNEYVNHKSENGLIETGHNDKRRAYYDLYPLDCSSSVVKDDVTLHVLTHYRNKKNGSSIFSFNRTSESNCKWLHSWGHEFSTQFTFPPDDGFPKCHMRVIKVGNTFYELSYNHFQEKYINFGIQDSIHKPITKVLKHPPVSISNTAYYRLQICGNDREDNNINLYPQNGKLLQYNCKLDQWFPIQVQGIPSSYYYTGCCSVVDNLVYLTGTVVERGCLNFNSAYDSRMEKWLLLPTEFYSWSWHSSLASQEETCRISDICVHQGELYAVYKKEGNGYSYIVRYDSRAQKWVEISMLPAEVTLRLFNRDMYAEPMLVSYRNELWIFSSDRKFRKFNIEKYDFTSGKSQNEPSLNVAVEKAHFNNKSVFLDAIIC